MKQLRSYNIMNDTDSYAVVIDNRYQLFQTAAETEEIRTEIFKDSDGTDFIGGTAFSFYEVLPPQSGRADGERLSEYPPCDLRTYMDTTRKERNERVKNDTPPDFKAFFGDMLA